MGTQVRYLVDEQGCRTGVVLDPAEYERMLEELEELESIRAYDAAKASGDEAVSFEQAAFARRGLRTGARCHQGTCS